MEILVCIKRVPTVGGRIAVTADGQEIDTRMSGFSISPHEECAVEEAVQLTERLGGTVSVLTLGPEVAIEQLRDALALGAGRAVLLETDGREFGPIATAAAIASEVRAHPYDLVLLGNEAADTGDYQVGIRLAHELGWPVATGIKSLSVSGSGDGVVARREYRGVEEAYQLSLPAVITVKEGINLPRYPSLPGRLRAKRAAVERSAPPFWRRDCARRRCGCPPRPAPGHRARERRRRGTNLVRSRRTGDPVMTPHQHQICSGSPRPAGQRGSERHNAYRFRYTTARSLPVSAAMPSRGGSARGGRCVMSVLCLVELDGAKPRTPRCGH